MKNEMQEYYRLVAEELLLKLNQVKRFIKKHNPTIGLLTEEVLRSFLQDYLPKRVSVEQGFILSSDGSMSKQCDILIYDSHNFAPYYRINDVVVVPGESVIAVIEVKTTITKQIFHSTIKYFDDIRRHTAATTFLFIYHSKDILSLDGYFHSYKHPGNYQKFDHDTFGLLPDRITGINSSYHLQRDYVITDSDYIGYTSYFYQDEEGKEISALQLFFESVEDSVRRYKFDETENDPDVIALRSDSRKGKKLFKELLVIELNYM